MGLYKEFKEFAIRGNVLDMAIGIVIGGAFGKIVSSLVTNVIMPPLGLLISGVDFAHLKVVLKQAVTDAQGAITPEVAIGYGSFINTIVEFLIIAFAIFLALKVINKFKQKEEAAPPAPSKEEELLTEIRDLLKKNKQ
ncbi:MAG: large-conductance mechanosensitive channel protein MscL [Tannerella sp.]|jgi:large conductance mechanosensitive channel|nr:large-conductance mechanosensitive channel protein MscL [Tannerella sp.]